ncbi:MULTISPECIES: CYTH domain-containing protein [Pseudomonas]|uniref:CYTH domain-containing protein n=1 Tax=Pseudomonas TaxID=286 RepID=UPI000F0424E4|nr:CYTH domain-containing protein [Pseudomonas viridiflava]
MTFPNMAGHHPDIDSVLRQELTQAGIEVHSLQFLLNGKSEVNTSIRGSLHGWEFERSWSYWVATGPGIDADTADALHNTHGNTVRIGGHCGSPSPREFFQGLGCGHYHVDDQQGLKALADAILSVVKANAPDSSQKYAEQNSIGDEIERKFLVKDGWRPQVESSSTLCQGYLNSDPARTVRVRIQDGRAVQTIKGLSDESGEKRPELNKKLTLAEADFMLDLCEPGMIDKTRHYIPAGEHLWEIDEFHGANEGLVVAEISFKTQGEDFLRPEWLGEEVTGRLEFYNSYLAKHPFNSWVEDKAPDA